MFLFPSANKGSPVQEAGCWFGGAAPHRGFCPVPALTAQAASREMAASCPGSGLRGPPAGDPHGSVGCGVWVTGSGAGRGVPAVWQSTFQAEGLRPTGSRGGASGRWGESCFPPSFSPSIMKGVEMAATDTSVCVLSPCPPAAPGSATHRVTYHPSQRPRPLRICSP